MGHHDASADIAESARLGDGCSVWGFAQIREGAVLGHHCVIGRGAYIGPGVAIGDRVKIQNLAQIYEPAVIGDGAFVGPAAVLTNDTYPRAVHPDGSAIAAGEWKAVGVAIEEGASIGARSVCVAPVTIGAWAVVAAGSTVIRDVPAHAMVAGTPARFVHWVGRTGRRLETLAPSRFRCADTGRTYYEIDHVLMEESK